MPFSVAIGIGIDRNSVTGVLVRQNVRLVSSNFVLVERYAVTEIPNRYPCNINDQVTPSEIDPWLENQARQRFLPA
jgi:hypothetical protein